MPIFRRLRPDESPSIHLLLLADPSEVEIRSYLDRSDCYVLEREEGERIGQVLILRKDESKMEIMNLAVEEKLQGQGFGRILLENSIQVAKDAGARTLTIGTGNSSLSQLGLYQKCGFEIFSIDKGFFLRNYKEPIWENGIRCKDKILLHLDL
ncbi:GNAT family N-acetyltransferase [Leptospira wolffii]|uniref:GNAT family N-acetyltransferase n=1 Tax=Leptospira wolffii TaxID=409998 RepID=UPI000353C98F|nr:GNAT family N-acetyltransferase [Leptospira wolffii]EPG67272.1 putative N-acetyltransferase YvbK [Leptospira wolffii serovar Khorat str. Khorat-H2]